ncbi:hypothetical protein ACWEQ8_13740 [Streptomyces noursei]
MAVPVAALAAVGCTAYSADTGWRFAADYLDMGSTIERAAMFATAELALFATALMARQNLHSNKREPGLPGILVWIITGVQIIPAYAESGPVGGTVRALIGPVMAAMLWHLAMGIELRHRTPRAASRSLTTVLARQAREQLLARLGIAEDDADAAQLIRERALSRAVTLILHIEAMTEKKRTGRRGQRATRRLHDALERAGVDSDPLQDELLLRKLGTRQQATRLAYVPLPARWDTPDTLTTRPRTAPAKRAQPKHPTAVLDPGDKDEHRSLGPESTDRPQSPRATPQDLNAGKPAGANPGTSASTRTRTKASRPGRKPDLPWDVLIDYAHRIYRETGRLSRDLLKEAVRTDGHHIGTDLAQRVVNAVKAEPKDAARAGHPH